MADAKITVVEHLKMVALRCSESSNAKILELTNAITDVGEELDSVKADAESTETALAKKQDKLTFDTSPTNGSTNPVTSGGVYKAIGDIGTILDSINGEGI